MFITVGHSNLTLFFEYPPPSRCRSHAVTVNVNTQTKCTCNCLSQAAWDSLTFFPTLPFVASSVLTQQRKKNSTLDPPPHAIRRTVATGSVSLLPPLTSFSQHQRSLSVTPVIPVALPTSYIPHFRPQSPPMTTKLDIPTLSDLGPASINAWLGLCQDSFDAWSLMNPTKTIDDTLRILLAGIK